MSGPHSPEEIAERWARVQPEAVCGGSDAQAINVFREALADIQRLAALAVAPRLELLRRREAITRLVSAVQIARGSCRAPFNRPDANHPLFLAHQREVAVEALMPLVDEMAEARSVMDPDLKMRITEVSVLLLPWDVYRAALKGLGS